MHTQLDGGYRAVHRHEGGCRELPQQPLATAWHVCHLAGSLKFDMHASVLHRDDPQAGLRHCGVRLCGSQHGAVPQLEGCSCHRWGLTSGQYTPFFSLPACLVRQ
jgi:hypothetical protein